MQALGFYDSKTPTTFRPATANRSYRPLNVHQVELGQVDTSRVRGTQKYDDGLF